MSDKKFWPALVLGLFLGGLWQGAEAQLEVSGYYKNLFVNSRTLGLFAPQQPYSLDLNRLRLKLKGSMGEETTFNVQYNNEVLLGDYLKTNQFLAQKNLSSDTFFNLDRTYVDNTSVYARHGFYRAFLDTRVAGADVRIGRQRIAWGSALFWSPVDIINPFNPTQIEREERVGVDAVVVDWDYNDLSRLSMVYAAHDSPVRNTTAIRWRTNIALYDWGVTAGRFRNDTMAGIDFAGQLGPVGLRGEWTQTSSPVDGQYQRAVLGADYSFPNTLSFMVELYYNGQGESDPSAYDFGRLLSGKIQSLARRYVGALVGYDISPLWKLQNYYIQNLDDGSEFLYLRLIVSATDNIEWAVGTQLFNGNSGSEYGTFENNVTLQMQWFF